MHRGYLWDLRLMQAICVFDCHGLFLSIAEPFNRYSRHMMALGSFLEVFSIFMLSLVRKGQYYQVNTQKLEEEKKENSIDSDFFPPHARFSSLKQSESGWAKLCFSSPP